MSIRAFAEHLGVSARMVSKWEAGGQHLTPRPMNQAALDTSLNRLTDAERDLFERLRAAPDPEGERLTSSVHGRTDPAALDTIAAVLAQLRRLEDVTSAADVLPSVRVQAQLTGRLATNARSAVRAKAVGLLSELEQYQGWLQIPMGGWAESRRHLDRAAVLAMESDDPQRLSTALSFSAYRALRMNELRAADALNEAAGRDKRAHIALRTYVAFQRAEVLARDGSRFDALGVLDVADGMMGQLTDDLPDSGYWYTPAFFLGQRAFVLHALGDDQGARHAAAESLAALPATWRDAEWAGRRRALAAIT